MVEVKFNCVVEREFDRMVEEAFCKCGDLVAYDKRMHTCVTECRDEWRLRVFRVMCQSREGLC